MMRVYAISDLHGNIPHIPECELLLLGGDYSPSRNVDVSRKWLDGEFRQFLEDVPARYIVGIAGNHDFAFQEDRAFAESLPWIYLQDKAVNLEGIKIYGTPWTPRFFNWAFMEEEGRLQERFKSIPPGLDILLTHGPAYRQLDRNEQGIHCGSFYLLDRIKTVFPDSVVCGHIHEARGVTETEDGTRYYNVAYVDGQNSPKYNAVNIPLVWDKK